MGVSMARSGRDVDRALSVGPWTRSGLTDAIIAASAGVYGYRPLSVGIDRASFARTLRPAWATVAAVVTAPTIIGLLFLLVRTTESFMCTVREDHTGISARIHGRLHPALLARIEELCARGPGEAPVPSAPPGLAAPVAGIGPAPASPAARSLLAAGPLPQSAAVSAPQVIPSLLSPSPWLLASQEMLEAEPVLNESTRVAATLRGSRRDGSRSPLMMLRFDDGRLAEISGFALIGRNPIGADGDPQAKLVVVDHDTVSKTHLAVGVSDGVAWVADRHSTNGSAVIDRTGNERKLVPGERVPVEVGTTVRLGDCWARVERLA